MEDMCPVAAHKTQHRSITHPKQNRGMEGLCPGSYPFQLFMNTETFNAYIKYRQGQIEAKKMITNLIGKNEDKIFSTVEFEENDSIAQIQEGLRKGGHHIMETELGAFFSICYDQLTNFGTDNSEVFRNMIQLEEESVVRIPRLLNLHERFENIVVASPYHPFDITPRYLLRNLYIGEKVVIESPDEVGVFYDDTTWTAGHTAPGWFVDNHDVTFIPHSTSDSIELTGGEEIIENDSLVAHWRFCCLDCLVEGDLRSLVESIECECECLQPLWIAALDMNRIQMMVYIDADSRQEWQQLGVELANRLAALEVKATLIPFGERVPLPGNHSQSELIYYDDRMLDPYASDFEDE